ncbi:MAG: ExbD/TolR family protein [Gammaproteobacteria bacterium]
MNLKPRRHEDPELSVVSLIDVVLMLLIFFILSTSFIHPGRIRVLLPQASASAQPVPEAITVTITKSGSYLVNDRALVNPRAATLRAALEKVAGADRKRPIIVRADRAAATQTMVTVMDVAGALGFTRIDIVTTHGGGDR